MSYHTWVYILCFQRKRLVATRMGLNLMYVSPGGQISMDKWIGNELSYNALLQSIPDESKYFKTS